jgi:hypothetical protein
VPIHEHRVCNPVHLPCTASFPAAWAVNTGGSTGTGPWVFLNYMTFDKNYVPVADVSQTNYVRISTAAKETGTDIPHQKLTATVTVKQAGYMYIYYSNEESTTNYEAFPYNPPQMLCLKSISLSVVNFQ